MQPFYFELENGESEGITKNEKDNHEVMWIKKNEVEKRLTVDGQKYIWNVLLKGESAYVEDGVLADSGDYTRIISEQAREKMTQWLEKNNLGGRKVNYKMRDWLVSRQRYWGAPIPIIYCDKCGTVPVPEKELPVELPDDVDFLPTGESPLVHSKKFHDVKCPICGADAKRESDTMDTFVCSSWYYFRYADPENKGEFASKDLIKKWLPVDLYVGGAEHTVLHLLYARFFTKVLHKLGYIDFDEPFLKLRHQGIILGEDSQKMSKSRGNVVNPDDVISKYGADTLRMFEMFMGPLEDTKPWQTKGIVGIKRFLERVWFIFSHEIESWDTENSDENEKKLNNLINKAIKKVTEDIENLRFNTAISSLMIFINESKDLHIYKQGRETLIFEKFLKLLSPFAPHLAEELWSKFGHTESIFKEKWPEHDPKLIKDEEINLVIQVNGKVRDNILVAAGISEEEAKEKALASEKVKKHIEGKKIKKTIFVKDKIINIVI
jgi:leucyl-tRNA synthetase